jgi:hypothetical protein
VTRGAQELLPAKYFNGRMQNKEYEQMGLDDPSGLPALAM